MIMNTVTRTAENTATKTATIRPVRLIVRPAFFRYLLAWAICLHISGKLTKENTWKMTIPGTATISRNPYSAFCCSAVYWMK